MSCNKLQYAAKNRRLGESPQFHLIDPLRPTAIQRRASLSCCYLSRSLAWAELPLLRNRRHRPKPTAAAARRRGDDSFDSGHFGAGERAGPLQEATREQMFSPRRRRTAAAMGSLVAAPSIPNLFALAEFAPCWPRSRPTPNLTQQP